MMAFENHNQWLIDLSREDIWTNEIEHIPSMLYFSYMQLKRMAQNGQVYGVMLQCKDLYESLYRIPAIIALVIIENDPLNRNREGYAEVIRDSLALPMSMGQWDKLANTIIKKAKAFELPDELVDILKETRALYELDVSDDYPNVVNWRNGAIGHGALKIEDDPSYQVEIHNLLSHLKTYFEQGSSRSVSKLYENIYFYTSKVKLIGPNGYKPGEKMNIMLSVCDKTYSVTNYISKNDIKLYIFNSFYSQKSLIKYSSYIDGQEEMANEEYFSRLYDMYVVKGNKNFNLNSKKITREQEQALECLSMPSEYIKPTRLIQRLRDEMDAQNKGVISIFMERGTGKSAFSNQMSGLFHKKGLIKKSFSRCYHVQNAALRGMSDFINALNFNFKHSYEKANDLFGGSDELLSLSLEEENPSESMAAFLNYYHEKYEQEYTILIIDGIDEITEKTKSILDYIPSAAKLAEGVFVVLLSRFKDEKTVLGSSVLWIDKAEELSDATIQVRRGDAENIEPLTMCIDKWREKNENGDAISTDELLARSDSRFLFLKAYLSMPYGVFLDNTNEQCFIQSYLDYIMSLYGPTQQHKIKEICVTFALFPSITLQQYQEYLNCELTYEFVGVLNDLMPLLTVVHLNGEDAYEFADTAYSEYILKNFGDVIPAVLNIFDVSFENHLHDFLSFGFSSVKASFDEYELDKLNKSITFFSEGLIGILNVMAENPEVIHWYYRNTRIWYLISSMMVDSWCHNGYGSYLVKELEKSFFNSLFFCVQNPDNEDVKWWIKKLSDGIRMGKGVINRINRIFISMEGADKVVQYIFDHPQVVDDNRDFIWLLGARKTMETVEFIVSHKLIESFIILLDFNRDNIWWYKAFLSYEIPCKTETIILNTLLKYYMSRSKKIRDIGTVEMNTDILLYLTRIKEKGFHIDPEVIDTNIDDLIEQAKEGTIWDFYFGKRIEKAIEYLNKLDINHVNSSPSFDVYLALKYNYAYLKGNDIVKKLHSAYYAKMNYMRINSHLATFLQHEVLLVDFIFDILTNEFGTGREYYIKLIEWIDTIQPLADREHGTIIILLSRMYLEAIKWLKKNSDFSEIIYIMEKYIYSGCDTRAFFYSYFGGGRITSAKPPEAIFVEPSRVYCCYNTLCLLDEYYQNGMMDKYYYLIKMIEESIPMIDNSQVTNDQTITMCEIAKYQFMRFRKDHNVSNEFDLYLIGMLLMHNDVIEKEMKSLSRESDFNKLLFHIEMLMQYYWQMEEWQEGILCCKTLIDQFKRIESYSDEVLRKSIDELVDKIEPFSNFFIHIVEQEKYSEQCSFGEMSEVVETMKHPKLSVRGLKHEVYMYKNLKEGQIVDRHVYHYNVVSEGMKPYSDPY